MFEIITNKIYDGVYELKQDFVRMFLIVGESRALLYDCGVGGHDLEVIVRKITNLPLDVVVSHAHQDHTNGASNFEKVYVHKLDEGIIKKGIEKEYISDGDVFDLGGMKLQAIHIPGHTPGCIALFDEKRKLLFGNDTLQEGPVFLISEVANFSDYVNSLNRLSELDFDICFASHHQLIVSKSYIPELIECVRAYRAGELDFTIEGEGNNAKKRFKKGRVSIYAN